MGLGALEAPPPELTGAAAEAWQCWNFCDGWNPQAWPVYAALYPVADWHLLVDLMAALRRA